MAQPRSAPAPSIFRYKDCEPLLLTAPNGTQFKFAGVRELLKPSAIAIDTALLPPDAIGAPASAAAAPAVPPLSAAQVCNQLRLHMRRSIAGYYEGRLRSDDAMTPCDTRNVCLAVREDARPGTVPPDSRCTGHMRQVVSESQLYTQVGVCYRAGQRWSAFRGLAWHVRGCRLPRAARAAVVDAMLTPHARGPARSSPTCTACLTWRACCTRWRAPRRARRRSRSWSPSGGPAGQAGVRLVTHGGRQAGVGAAACHPSST